MLERLKGCLTRSLLLPVKEEADFALSPSFMLKGEACMVPPLVLKVASHHDGRIALLILLVEEDLGLRIYGFHVYIGKKVQLETMKIRISNISHLLL